MRPYQVVVWGATGFTGKLTAEYLASVVPDGFRWAIAGRNRSRLEEVRKDVLKKARSSNAKVDILIGDSAKSETLDEITGATDVLISTVGPYVLYGTPLVQSCVKNKTDYVDITGESHWIRSIIKDFHQEAKEKGVAIVNSCGFDSIPSDLGALFVANHMKQKYGTRCDKITLYVTDIKGGVSGGTLASACSALETGAFSPENRHPYATEDHASWLNASKKKKITHRDTHDPMWINYDFDRASWTGPWFMASTNGKCVRRSNSLLGYAFGPELRYTEVMEHKNFLVAFFTTIFLFAFGLILYFAPTRNFVKRFLPQPGQGPSKELLASGYMKMTIIGTSESDPNNKITAVVQAAKEPGYAFTAVMLAESALCLALQRDEVNKIYRQRKGEDEPEVLGGILTPASAMGPVLLDRLTRAGMKFNVV